MAKYRYYGVAGRNGYGVYNNYSKVMATKGFVAGFKTKGFYDFPGAKQWAEDIYNEYQKDEMYKYTIPEIVETNWFYYREIIVSNHNL